MLLPALGNARDMAKRINGVANLRQFGLAQYNYADSYNNWVVYLMPFVVGRPVTTTTYDDFHQGVFLCPGKTVFNFGAALDWDTRMFYYEFATVNYSRHARNAPNGSSTGRGEPAVH